MKFFTSRFRLGLRTVKTAAAAVLAMVLVGLYGANESNVFFAIMGAMVVMEPTFNGSVEACLNQIVGVTFGAAMGLLLFALRLPPLVALGIGIVLVIVLYNGLKIRFSPTLACFMVVTLCIDPGLHPVTYALERLWDTAIGLVVGTLELCLRVGFALVSGALGWAEGLFVAEVSAWIGAAVLLCIVYYRHVRRLPA
jgi:uncharacterized membrane protein YgaE (UPF0421/DUF939 family)